MSAVGCIYEWKDNPGIIHVVYSGGYTLFQGLNNVSECKEKCSTTRRLCTATGWRDGKKCYVFHSNMINEQLTVTNNPADILSTIRMCAPSEFTLNVILTTIQN